MTDYGLCEGPNTFDDWVQAKAEQLGFAAAGVESVRGVCQVCGHDGVLRKCSCGRMVCAMCLRMRAVDAELMAARGEKALNPWHTFCACVLHGWRAGEEWRT